MLVNLSSETPLIKSVLIGAGPTELVVISYAESSIDLKQAGFARLIWLFANKFPLLYGIIAIILSGLLGWIVSILFTRLKLI